MKRTLTEDEKAQYLPLAFELAREFERPDTEGRSRDERIQALSRLYRIPYPITRLVIIEGQKVISRLIQTAFYNLQNLKQAA